MTGMVLIGFYKGCILMMLSVHHLDSANTCLDPATSQSLKHSSSVQDAGGNALFALVIVRVIKQ